MTLNNYQLMERIGCSFDEADNLLSRIAEDEGDKLRDEEALAHQPRFTPQKAPHEHHPTGEQAESSV